MELKENMVEFVTGQKTCTVSFSNPKHINKIKKLHSSAIDEFEFYKENTDGSICARIPLKWLKISPPRKMSEEQRQAAADRLRGINNAK